MRNYNKTQLTNSILHALACRHLTRSELMPQIMAEHGLSDITIGKHLNDLIKAGMIVREGKTTRQYYKLGLAGIMHYLEIMGHYSHHIKISNQ